MRKITRHEDILIEITVDDRDEKNGQGVYRISYNLDNGTLQTQQILFQLGPSKEFGVNGVTNEALLAILIDRVEGFQESKYTCKENEHALHALNAALGWLQHRTRNREAHGVEGTNIP